jgi:hypothetical protein
MHDLRHGLRSLRRTPIQSLTALFTLAFTIAGVATVVTIGDALLLKPPAHRSTPVTPCAYRAILRARFLT